MNDHMPDTSKFEHPPARQAGWSDPGRAVLLASAFVIAAMILVQAGRLPGNPAYAGMTSTKTVYSLLTADSGRGPDAKPHEIFLVIDNRTEALVLYELDAQNRQIVPRDGGFLPTLFQRGVGR